MSSQSLFSASIILSLSVLVACAADQGEDGISDDTNPVLQTTPTGTNPGTTATATGTTVTTTGGAEISALRGMVLDPSQYPIEGVTVTTSTGLEDITDAQGRWGFEDLDDIGLVAVNFSKAGYAHNQKPITVYELTEHALNTTMSPVDFTGSFSPDDGLAINIDDGGAEIDLPSGLYFTEAGEPISGDVVVDATLFDVLYTPGAMMSSGGSERDAAPGDFSATDGEGEDQVLESFGMIQVNLTDANGDPIVLPEGETAIIKIGIQGSGPVDGDAIPAWSYDEDEFRWIEEGDGYVKDRGEGDLVWEFEATHFSSWNTDYPISTHGCVICDLGELSALPITGVSVTAQGVSYNSSTSGSIDSSGRVCVEVKNDSTISLTTSYTLGGQTFTEQWGETLSIPPFEATCNSDQTSCTDLGACPLNIPF